MRARVVLVVATLLATWAAAIAAQAQPTREDLCEPWHIAPLRAARPGEIVLPVIVHHMKSTKHSNKIWNVFTERIVTAYFRGEGTIRTIWRPAGVQLFLHRIERCQYDPVTMTGQSRNQPEELPDPTAGADGPTMFRRVGDFYNYDRVRGLDLYLWWEIGGRFIGYARPYELSDGTRTTGGVWVDRQCVQSEEAAPKCERLIAHEIGHFLGLCHRCRVTGDAATPCTACVGHRIPDCSSRRAEPLFIMRSRFDGTKLDGCEIERATAQARDRIKGNTRP